MIRRLYISLLLGVMSVCISTASTVHDVAVNVVLHYDGSARIVETWSLTQDSGTEWYLVKSNLGDIQISDFSVADETGTEYYNEGSDWNLDRSLSQKAYRCGMVVKKNGCELCWGLGSLGSHVYRASYSMSNIVKSMDDYDCLHMQFVSPGLSSSPQHVKLTITCPGVGLSEENCRIWGFGYNGTMVFSSDGSVVAESDRPFSSNSSMIALIRFDKGIFAPRSTIEGTFQNKLDQAMEGSNFDDDDFTVSDFIAILVSVVLMLSGVIWLLILIDRNRKKRILGVKTLKEIEWCRDVPFNGNLLESDYVLRHVDGGGSGSVKGNMLASALILQMLYDGAIVMRKDQKDHVELLFSDKGLPSDASSTMRELYEMMHEASGSDSILQEKEFSRWARTHTKRISKWMEKIESDSISELHSCGHATYSESFTVEGQAEARKLIGFRKFLKDFTLTEERVSQEVAVWNEYLIFGSLFGIAEKVAKELGHINPQAFSETVLQDPYLAGRVMNMNSRLASSITSANAEAIAKATGGYGGRSSFGGGGGFSGGGFGGGAR